MFGRRRRNNNRNSRTSAPPSVPPERPVSALPPNTPGVQIFGENYSGPQVLQKTAFHKTLDRNSKVSSIMNSVRVLKGKTPIEKLKIRLKELDTALENGVLDQFQFEDAKRKALEEAKAEIASHKRSSIVNEESTTEGIKIEDLEHDEEVQTLLESNKVVAAVELEPSSNQNINQTDQFIIDVQIDETDETILRELEEPVPVVEHRNSQVPVERSPISENQETALVSAFAIEDIEGQDIVLGNGDFVITDTNFETLDEGTEQNQASSATVTPSTSANIQPETVTAVIGGSMLFNINDSENVTDTAVNQSEEAELEFLMMGLPKEVAKPKATNQELVELEQAKEFAFKHENPPNQAKFVVPPVIPELKVNPESGTHSISNETSRTKVHNKVKKDVEHTTSTFNLPEDSQSVQPFPASSLYLTTSNFGVEDNKPAASEADELALLMGVTKISESNSKPTEPTKHSKKNRPKAKPSRPVKPITFADVPKLEVKPSKSAVISNSEQHAFAMLMEPGQNPFSGEDDREEIVKNNKVLLVNDEDSTDSEEDMTYASSAKPVFYTTDLDTSAKKKKVKQVKPSKTYYNSAGLSANVASKQPTHVVKKPKTRAFVVHGLLAQMEKEGKDPLQCLESLQDLARTKTLSNAEVDLGKEILVKTKGLKL